MTFTLNKVSSIVSQIHFHIFPFLLKSVHFLIRVSNSNGAEGGSTVYSVETKAQGQLSSPNVQRKLKAAVAWCERINGVAAEQRRHETWHYVLLGESTVAQWQQDNKRCSELLSFAKLRNTTVSTQERLI